MSAVDPLGSPNGPLMCQPVPITTADSAAFVYELRDGQVSGERRTLVAFDSAGVPLYLTVTAQGDSTAGGVAMHFFVVRLHPFRGGTHLIVRGQEIDTTRAMTREDRAAGLPPGASSLSVEELARSEQLGNWVWSHRCQ